MVQTRTSTRLNGEASPHRQSSRSSPAASFSEAESKQSIERILSPGTSDQRQLQGVGCRTSARMTARSARSTANLTIIAAEHIRSPATALDRQDWQGWCEIESEPVSHPTFSSILWIVWQLECSQIYHMINCTPLWCLLRHFSMLYSVISAFKTSRYRKLSVLTRKC